MMICQLQEMVKHGVASSIMRTGRVYAIKRTKEALRQKQKQRSGSVTSGNSREVLMKQMAEKQGVNENLKRQDQMKWVRLMNNVKASAEEIVMREIVYV